MSYDRVLEKAGAEVHDYATFGTYQGKWLAYVTYRGDTGFVSGYFGSCSGCDAYLAEFSMTGHYGEDGDYHYSVNTREESCEQCQKVLERIGEFGRGYLEDGLLDKEEAMAVAEDVYGMTDKAIAFVEGQEA